MSEESVKAGLEQQIIQALANGYTTFITGMAQGVDLWAGKIVADLRDNGLPIKLVAANPYPGFGKGWEPEWKSLHQEITSRADLVENVCKAYNKGCFMSRNKWMVDHSDLLIAVNDAGLKANDNPVQLTFDHAMAKLIVNLSFHNQWTEGNPPSQTDITEAKIDTVRVTAKDHATIDYILKAENPIKEKADPKPLDSFEGQVELRDVSFQYIAGRDVLKHINLRVPKGKTVALVGQSGSGKSTLVDLIPRYHDVCGGQILIDGKDIRDVKIHDLRALIGNVNQEAILFNDTFYNNITFGVENATMEQVVEAAKIANAHDFIMETENGYNTVIGDRGGRLSGGQRQRVSIARAILKNPPILILDEATSALDTESEHLVQEALDRLMKSRTTIAIAHRLSTIKNADIIHVLYEGEIVESGQHDELIAKNGYYKRLYDMQQL